MTIADNRKIICEINEFLTAELPIKLGVNKLNELTRLTYEISRSRGLAAKEVFRLVGTEKIIEDGKGALFHRLKNALLEARYPSITSGDDPRIMPLKIDGVSGECPVWDFKLDPKNIFIEKSVQDLDWTKKFLENFPAAKHTIIDSRFSAFGGPASGGRGNDEVDSRGNDILRKTSVEIYNKRRENIFLVKAKSDFVKMCPCTKEYKRCGYWILNIGFGCPMDCSYCYLQLYSNAPGLVLTANIEDYYDHIKKLDKKLTAEVRIGTGEFTDSLALDKYAGYSNYLIPFFRGTKNLVLELKTKAGDIENVLKENPHDNVVISWSINTRRIAERHERGGASIAERIGAAREAAKRGYKISFHFDPICYYKGWEDEYKDIIGELFSFDEIKRNTLWISLGTLRYTPGLKQVAEQRFADNSIFYESEFFIDTDGKLRYPRPLRINMYNKMINWIKKQNDSCWVYLCMEPEKFWRESDCQDLTPMTL